MYQVLLLNEVDNGWGYEVIVKHNKHILEHTDVGYFDLNDWLDEKFGLDKCKIINKTALV